MVVIHILARRLWRRFWTIFDRMRRLTATGAPLDALEAMVALLPTMGVEPPPERPWVSTDMVMSMDGAYSRGGTSGALSSPADHALFIAHRSLSDAILVGASTVRKERYRRPSVSEQAREVREHYGQRPVPELVITSASLDLGAGTPLLHGDPPVPIIAHPASADTRDAPEGFELIDAGDTQVDLRLLMSILRDRGVRRIACEGGPHLLGQLAAEDLIDEYLVTISPQLVGGAMVGLLGGGNPQAARFELYEVLRDGEHLMCSYRRDRDRES